MNQAHFIIDFLDKYLIRSQLFISMVATVYVAAGFRLMGFQSANGYLLAVVFIGTLICYHFHRTVDFICRSHFYKIHKSLVLLIVVSGSIALALLPFLWIDRITWLIAMHLVTIAVFYNLPSSLLPTVIQIRRWLYFKSVWVAYVWAGLAILIPGSLSDASFTQISLLFMAQFCMILAITIPFDFKDQFYDQQQGLHTIAHRWGTWGTKSIALIVYLIAVYLAPSPTPFILGVYLATAILILFSGPKQAHRYYTFALDGMILLYALSILSGMHSVI